MRSEDVCKKCRRAGVKLFLKGERCFTPKCSFTKRPYAPGMHGQKRKGRPSEYLMQLREKQKAKAVYGLSEQTLKNYLEKASRKGDKGEELFKMFEKRLDNVLYRGGLAPSRRAARQIVNHGGTLVNDKKVDIPSYQVKNGQTIKLTRSTDTKAVGERPDWIALDAKTKTLKVNSEPTLGAGADFDIKIIIEYYSR